MKKSCEEIRDMLVDHADGELPASDSQVVAKHLAECPACREIVEGLHRSLYVAKAIWQDNHDVRTVHRHVVRRLCCAGIAASILIAASVLLLNVVNRPTNLDVTYAQIEQQVTRAGAAARLLAATQILAACEGTESLVEGQRQYVLDTYPDTPVAGTLKAGNHLRIGEIDHD